MAAARCRSPSWRCRAGRRVAAPCRWRAWRRRPPSAGAARCTSARSPCRRRARRPPGRSRPPTARAASWPDAAVRRWPATPSARPPWRPRHAAAARPRPGRRQNHQNPDRRNRQLRVPCRRSRPQRAGQHADPRRRVGRAGQFFSGCRGVTQDSANDLQSSCIRRAAPRYRAGPPAGVGDAADIGSGIGRGGTLAFAGDRREHCRQPRGQQLGGGAA